MLVLTQVLRNKLTNFFVKLAAKDRNDRSINRVFTGYRAIQMTNINLTFLLAIITLLLLGCSEDEPGIVISEINLDEELTLSIRENFNTPEDGDFLARLTTNTEYDCQEGQLIYNLINKEEENQIIVNVTGLDFPIQDECVDKDVAAADLDLGQLTLNEEHSIRISLLGEVRNHGTILNLIDRVSIDIAEETGSGISLANSSTFKIADDVVWGFLSAGDQSVPDSVHLAFINEIESLGSPIEKVGAFGHFTVGNDGNADIFDFEKGNTVENPGIAIRYTDSFEALEEYVQVNFCTGGYRIRIWDTQGNQISCN